MNDLKRKFDPIAIIGMSAIFPRSNNTISLWENIIQGKDLIRDVPESHWLINDYYDPNPGTLDKTYCKRGGFLDPLAFDPLEFGVPPNVVPAIDTAQLLALLGAKAALQDALGDHFHEMDLSRMSVILGSAALEALQYTSSRLQRPVWKRAMQAAGLENELIDLVCEQIEKSYTPWQENTFPGLLSNVVAGRIANRFNLGGSNYITDAACAGSLAALSSAINELQLGLADCVLTGGVDALNDIVMFMCFSKTGALSQQNDCRPFSDQADGTVLGEGLGMLVLKRLQDAEAAGDRIYAVIRGLGTSSDGRSKSIYAPVAEGQSKAILKACEIANVKPETIELIEAHGTGTKAGDLAEFEGLNLVFSADRAKQTCALGSIKSQIGHTKSAAGAAGLIKTILALHHKTLPPTIKIDRPNPELKIEKSAFYLNTETRPWIQQSDTPRRASVSAFGFGGSNFHVVLEEYTGKNKRPPRYRILESELIILTADNISALKQEIQKTIDHIPLHTLSSLAHQTQTNFNERETVRLAIVAESMEDVYKKLTRANQIITLDSHQSIHLDHGIYFSSSATSAPIAFVFNGLGTQCVNMGKTLVTSFDEAIEVWDENAKFLKEIALKQAVFPHDLANKQIDHPAYALPALVTHTQMQLRLLQLLNISSDIVAGHGFGECVALHYAGCYSNHELLTLAHQYGQALFNLPNQLSQLEIIFPVTDLKEKLKECDFSIMSVHSLHQCIIEAEPLSMQTIKAILLKDKIACYPVKHKSLHKVISNRKINSSISHLIDKLSVNPLRKKVISSTNGTQYEDDAKKIKQQLMEHFTHPIEFQKQIEQCYAEGVRIFIEVGPSGRLTHYINQTLKERSHVAIYLDQGEADAVSCFWHGLAKMVVSGMNPSFSNLWKNVTFPQLEKQFPKHALKINGTNYGKPYPASAVNDTANVFNNFTNKRAESMSYNNSLQMLHEMQRQLVDAQAAYQRSMTDSHLAFMQTMSQLSSQLTGQPQPVVTHSLPPVPAMQPMPTLSNLATVMPQPQIQMAPPPPIPMPAEVPKPMPMEVSKPTMHSAPSADLKDELLQVIVDKTGYPAEMLNMDMHIEADLGIDSIKRVEIMSALAEKIPNFPELNPADLGKILTLKDILTHIQINSKAACPA